MGIETEYRDLLDNIEQTEEGFTKLFKRLDSQPEQFLKAIKWRYKNKPLAIKGSESLDYSPNRFLFSYGHLLTVAQLKCLLSDKEIKANFKKDFTAHQLTIALASWPVELINAFYESIEAKEKGKILSLLLAYTSEYNSNWFNSKLSLVTQIPKSKDDTHLWFELFRHLDKQQTQAVFDELLATPGLEALKAADAAIIHVLLSKTQTCEQIQAILDFPPFFKALTDRQLTEKKYPFNLVNIILSKRFDEKTTNALFTDSKVQALVRGKHILKARLARPTQHYTPPVLLDSSLKCLIANEEIKTEYQLAVKETFERYLVNEIFDSKYDKLGKGFFSHKTPRHILALRHVLGPREKIRFPLDNAKHNELVSVAQRAGNRSHWWFNSRHRDVQKLYELIRENSDNATQNTEDGSQEVKLCESGRTFYL